MNFSAEHIELDSDELWFLPDTELEVPHDRAIELYLRLEQALHIAIEEEFAILNNSRHTRSLEEALTDMYNRETTYLAGKLIVLNKFIINYTGS